MEIRSSTHRTKQSRNFDVNTRQADWPHKRWNGKCSFMLCGVSETAIILSLFLKGRSGLRDTTDKCVGKQTLRSSRLLRDVIHKLYTVRREARDCVDISSRH